MNRICFEGEGDAHAGGLPVLRVAPVDLIEAVSPPVPIICETTCLVRLV